MAQELTCGISRYWFYLQPNQHNMNSQETNEFFLLTYHAYDTLGTMASFAIYINRHNHNSFPQVYILGLGNWVGQQAQYPSNFSSAGTKVKKKEMKINFGNYLKESFEIVPVSVEKWKDITTVLKVQKRIFASETKVTLLLCFIVVPEKDCCY